MKDSLFRRTELPKMKLLSIFTLILALLLSIAPSHAVDNILIIRPAGPDFEETVGGLADELDGEIAYQELILDKNPDIEPMYRAIQTQQPKALVLMGNRQLNLFKRMKSAHPNDTFPPVVAVAALFIDRVMADSPNVTGILYEVPAVTGLVSLRNISKQPIKRIGVLYQKEMVDMINLNQQFCEAEGFELVATGLSRKDTKDPKRISKALKKLSRQSLDAIWISNDSGLLTRDLVLKSWIPFMKKFNKPVLVGVGSLVSTKLNMGNLAVSPDHSALGSQAAGLLFDLMDDDWQLDENRFDQPISVLKILNLQISRQRKIDLDEERLSQIDKLIQ